MVHDYLAPFKRMPKLHAPSPTGRIGFAPVSLHLKPLPSLLVGEGPVGYRLFRQRGTPEAHVNWDVTTTLVQIDWRGRAVKRLAQRRRHVPAVSPRHGAGVEFTVGKDPAVYRVTVVFHNESGRKLGGYGFYFRVVAPSQNTKFTLTASSYSPEHTVFGRVENFGSEPVYFGAPYVIERLEGSTWARAPESPRSFILPLYGAGPGASGSPCSGFWIPPTMQPGRYRMSKEIAYASQPFARGRVPVVLSAEFDVTS